MPPHALALALARGDFCRCARVVIGGNARTAVARAILRTRSHHDLRQRAADLRRASRARFAAASPLICGGLRAAD
jgi:hypothetical protein